LMVYELTVLHARVWLEGYTKLDDRNLVTIKHFDSVQYVMSTSS
jgi:hypothetical protein